MNWTLISFYTPLYKESAERLKASCVKFNVPFFIEERPSKSTWEANCCMKPNFIYEKLQELKSPVLWVDADAEIVRPLADSFPGEFSTVINLDLPLTHPSHVVSCVVYAEPGSLGLIEKWITLCDDKEWDQVALKEALQGYDTSPLPREYSMIYDRLEKDDQPMIIHYQASRLTKKVISGEVAPFLNP